MCWLLQLWGKVSSWKSGTQGALQLKISVGKSLALRWNPHHHSTEKTRTTKCACSYSCSVAIPSTRHSLPWNVLRRMEDTSPSWLPGRFWPNLTADRGKLYFPLVLQKHTQNIREEKRQSLIPSNPFNDGWNKLNFSYVPGSLPYTLHTFSHKQGDQLYRFAQDQGVT